MSKILKIFIGLFVTLVILLGILLVLPFVVDLNRFKPQIQEAVTKQVNAKIDFSSIQLTILSGLGFKLEDVSIENTDAHFAKTKLLQVKEIKFQTELWPLLHKQIVGQLLIDTPDIKIIKSGTTNNITSLIKTVPSPTQQPTQGIKSTTESSTGKPATPAPAPEKKSAPIPEQKVIVQDKNENENKDDIKKNILIKSFIIQNANIAYTDMSKKEPILVKKMNVNIENIGLDKDTKITFSTNINLKDEKYTINGPLALKIIARTALDDSKWKSSSFNGEFNLDNLNINYNNAFVKTNKIPFHFSFEGHATPESLMLSNFKLNLQSLDMDAKVDIHDFKKLLSVISVTLSSKDVSSLGEILPQNKQLLSKGTFTLISNIQGPLSDTNTLSSATKLTANLFNTDINLALNETSIKPIKANLSVQSNNLDLGEIVKPFMSPSPEKSEFGIDYSTMKFHNLALNAAMNDNLVNVEKFNFDAFNGSLVSSFETDLAKNPMPYSGKMSFKKIEIQSLIKLIRMKQESPLEGVADVAFTFNGAGKTRDVVSRTLNVKGNYNFYSGKVNFKSILGLASDQLQKFAANLNIPGINTGLAKVGGIDLGQNRQKGLKDANGTFEVKNGKLIIDNLIASDQGNIKLNALVGLDESLGGTAVYTSTKQVTDLLNSQNKYFSYLFNNKGNLELHLILGGSISSPDVKIDPKNLQDNLMHNSTQALRDKAVSQIKEQIEKNPEAKKAEDSAKKLLKDKGLDLSKFGF